MQWTVQVIVALLNIVWIVFFLQPDPFSVSVQRRSSDSSDEEMLFGEFCIQLQSEMNWTSTVHSVTITGNKTNNTNTTSEGSRESNLTLHEIHSIKKIKIQHDCQCNKTNMQQKDLYSSQLSHIELRPPAPGCEPKIIMTFPNMEVCIDVEIYFSAVAPLVSDWDETTPASPPVLGLTSSEVTTASGLISSSSSAAARVTVTHQSKAPVQEKDNQNQRRHPGMYPCCVRVSNTRIPYETVKGYRIQLPNVCPIEAIILFTVSNKSYCVNPGAKWVHKLMKIHDNKSKSKK